MAHYVQVRMKFSRSTDPPFIHPTFTLNLQSPSTTTPVDTAAVFTQVSNFWKTLQGSQANILETYLSQCIPRGSAVHEVAIYDIDGSVADHTVPMGSPIATETYSVSHAAASGSAPMPEECALVLSYHGLLTGIPEFVGRTRPAARRRARMFMGPFNTSALGINATQDAVIGNQCQADFAQAFNASFLNELNPSAIVWSRTSNEAFQAVGCSVDSLWDTRKHRGDRRTATKTSVP